MEVRVALLNINLIGEFVIPVPTTLNSAGLEVAYSTNIPNVILQKQTKNVNQ